MSGKNKVNAVQIKKAYKFRLESSEEKSKVFLGYAGSCRFVWNYFLDQRKQYYEATGKGLSWVDQANQLSALKKFYPFLEEAPSQALQQVLRDLHQAFKNFFKGAGYPQFKKKHLHNSFRYPQGCSVEGSLITLPKIGEVKFRKSREIEGKIKNVTVSFRGGHWFVSIQTETEINLPKGEGEIGLDLGVVRFATLSNGKVFKPVDFSRLLTKQKKYQRNLSRKTKGSNRWLKSRQKIARIHQKIADKRTDFLHKISTELSKNHAVVHVEDLKVKEMTQSAKGTVDSPGKNVTLKSHLNKSILEQGWNQFMNFLTYKLEWRGGKLNAVNPHHTSQYCSSCGHIDARNRPSQAIFRCTACSFEQNADLNAAINILNLGRSGRPHLHVENSQGSLKRELSLV